MRALYRTFDRVSPAMVLLGLSFKKVGRDSKFNICQDSLFSVDSALPSEDEGPSSVSTQAAEDNDDSSCSVSAARLNSIPSFSADHWHAKTTKEREHLVASLRAAL